MSWGALAPIWTPPGIKYSIPSVFLNFMEPRNRFQMQSASLCSLAGRYDNPIPNRFLAPIDCLKIPALNTGCETWDDWTTGHVVMFTGTLDIWTLYIWTPDTWTSNTRTVDSRTHGLLDFWTMETGLLDSGHPDVKQMTLDTEPN